MLSRHDKYYFNDGSIIICVSIRHVYLNEHELTMNFQCGVMLYNLHKSLLSRKSELLSTMFEMPQPLGTMTEGSSDDNPVFINVLSKEFDYLLQYLYDLYVIESIGQSLGS